MARNLFVFTFLIWAIASFGRNAFGAEIKLVDMTNEEDSDVTQFILKTDDVTKDAIGFIKRTFNNRGKKINEESYSQDQVENGLVMENRKDRDIVILKSDNFSAHQGGDLEIDTLYSGVSDKRKSYYFDLQRDGDNWNLLYRNKKVSKVHLISNKAFLLGTIGIKDLVVR
ncbi:MAG: hypothetical protein Fur0010_05780 [Bdellovibrio sp.]